MSLKTKKPRASCDKQFSVSDCMNLLHEYLGASRDLSSHLSNLQEDWKSAPKPELLLPFLPFAVLLSKKCPSLLPQPSTMQLALKKLDEQHGPVNFSGVNREDWSNAMSGKLRAMLAKYRRVCLEDDTRKRFMHKLSGMEKKNMEELMAAMGKHMESEKAKQGAQAGGEMVIADAEGKLASSCPMSSQATSLSMSSQTCTLGLKTASSSMVGGRSSSGSKVDSPDESLSQKIENCHIEDFLASFQACSHIKARLSQKANIDTKILVALVGLGVWKMKKIWGVDVRVTYPYRGDA